MGWLIETFGNRWQCTDCRELFSPDVAPTYSSMAPTTLCAGCTHELWERGMLDWLMSQEHMDDYDESPEAYYEDLAEQHAPDL